MYICDIYMIYIYVYIAPCTINVTSKSPVGAISVVTLKRTDTTLDHSQKAETTTTNGGQFGYSIQAW